MLYREYSKQKNTAKYRGIDWDFTFETWLSVWEASGHISERGRGKGKYVMARFGDKGAYSPSNVEICTHTKNAKDSRTNHPRTKLDLCSKAIGKGRGWTKRNGSYQVTVSKKYIGTFKTIEEAELAYKQAVDLTLSRLVSLSTNTNNGEYPHHAEDSSK